MSPDDEKLALNKGHFLNRLKEAGLVDAATDEITPKGNEYVERMNATYIHLTINKMLSMNKRYQTVLAVVRDVGDYIGAVNLATAMHRLGRLVRSARANNPSVLNQVVKHPQYRSLLSKTEGFIDSMEPRALANFLWGMAALGDQQNTGIVLRLGRRLMEIDVCELKTQEISNVVWSLATLEMQMPELMDRMLNAACDRIHECVPQALSNMIWACATLRHVNGRFIAAVSESAAPRLDTFQSQTLANTLWAYSVLGVYPSELFNIAADEIVERLRMREKATASVKALKALKAVKKPPRMLQRKGEKGEGKNEQYEKKTGAKRELSAKGIEREQRAYYEFRGQEISNVLIAYARGCIIHPQLLECLEEELCGSVLIEVSGEDGGGEREREQSSGGNNGNTTGGKRAERDRDRERDDRGGDRSQHQSLALSQQSSGASSHGSGSGNQQGNQSQRAEYTVKTKKVDRLELFTSQALTNTLWAFATLRWYPARLLPCITQAMGKLVRRMTAQELANSLWSYARFAYHPGRVMWSFLAVMSLRIDEFEAQGCTNSLWALAVLKATHSPAFIKLLERYVALERTSVSFGELQYNQVLQAVLLAQFEARGGRVSWRPEVDLPEDVVDRALDAWASQQTSTQLSGFHLDVSEGLSRLGVSHCIEHLVARDLLSIDIAVVTEGRFIAIEVDGPFHFPVNARTPLGHTMIRRRLLRAAGWTVVPIPWYEWFEMKTWDERLQYLASALAKADESLLGQLRVQGTVRDMLSTDFLPGPGGGGADHRVGNDVSDVSDEGDDSNGAEVDIEERGRDEGDTRDEGAASDEGDSTPSSVSASLSAALTTSPRSKGSTKGSTKGSSKGASKGSSRGSSKTPQKTASVDEDSDSDSSDDGPVLAYELDGTGAGAVETGLMDALNRSNVQLTSGAIRRLKSMGLESKVKEITSRRKQLQRASGAKAKKEGDKGDKGDGATRERNARSSSPDNHRASPSSSPSPAPGSSLNAAPPARAVNTPPTSNQSSSPSPSSSSGTVPQPATRFNPKFVDSSEAGWSPYWKAAYVSSIDDDGNTDTDSDSDGSFLDPNPMNTSDKLFEKVLHGRESAQIIKGQGNDEAPSTPSPPAPSGGQLVDDPDEA